MENWKDYVGFQPIGNNQPDDVGGGMVFCLRCVKDGHTVTTTVERSVLTKDDYIYGGEIGYAVEIVLSQFPKFIPEKENTTFWNKVLTFMSLRKWIGDTDFSIWKQKHEVAKQTRRGVANTVYKNEWREVHFYSGNNMVDRPIIVSELNGKYAIWKHPDFDKYGFVVG